MASGGAGVASARPSMAPLFNPALRSTGADSDRGRLAMSLNFGGRLLDRDRFISGVRHYQKNNADVTFKAALDEFNAMAEGSVLTAESFDSLTSACNELFDDISGLSNRSLRFGGALSATLARPGPTGIAGFERNPLYWPKWLGCHIALSGHAQAKVPGLDSA